MVNEFTGALVLCTFAMLYNYCPCSLIYYEFLPFLFCVCYQYFSLNNTGKDVGDSSAPNNGLKLGEEIIVPQSGHISDESKNKISAGSGRTFKQSTTTSARRFEEASHGNINTHVNFNGEMDKPVETESAKWKSLMPNAVTVSSVRSKQQPEKDSVKKDDGGSEEKDLFARPTLTPSELGLMPPPSIPSSRSKDQIKCLVYFMDCCRLEIASCVGNLQSVKVPRWTLFRF